MEKQREQGYTFLQRKVSKLFVVCMLQRTHQVRFFFSFPHQVRLRFIVYIMQNSSSFHLNLEGNHDL